MVNWGKVGGQDAITVTISDGGKMSAKVSNFGARLIELWQPDRNGSLADIVLGHDRPDQYWQWREMRPRQPWRLYSHQAATGFRYITCQEVLLLAAAILTSEKAFNM